MLITDLDQAEQLALIGLARLMIRLDGNFSAEESALIDGIVGDLGEERFSQLMSEATEKMQSEESVKYHARHVARPEARELLYGVLFELAVPDTIVPAESALLAWLRDAWEISSSDGSAYRG